MNHMLVELNINLSNYNLIFIKLKILIKWILVASKWNSFSLFVFILVVNTIFIFAFYCVNELLHILRKNYFFHYEFSFQSFFFFWRRFLLILRFSNSFIVNWLSLRYLFCRRLTFNLRLVVFYNAKIFLLIFTLVTKIHVIQYIFRLFRAASWILLYYLFNCINWFLLILYFKIVKIFLLLLLTILQAVALFFIKILIFRKIKLLAFIKYLMRKYALFNIIYILK